MRKIIILNGSGGSGKTTFFVLCKNLTKIPCYNFSIVDPIKNIAKLLGWNGDKNNKSRKFLADLKDLSSDFNDFPLSYIHSKIESVKDSRYLIFVDIRDPEDIQKMRNKYTRNVIAVLLNRPDIIKNFTNHADKNVEDLDYDLIVDNDKDIKELKKSCETFLKEIGIREGDFDA